MRSTSFATLLLLSLACFTTAAWLGCGDNNHVDGDACVLDDAAPLDVALIDVGPVDAPADTRSGSGGLGQPCESSAQCPADAPTCIAQATDTRGICTAPCLTGMFLTDAASSPGPSIPDPSTGDATCAARYAGGPAGRPACGHVVRLEPDGQPMPNTVYTFDLVCEIRCGVGDACPPGLICRVNRCVPL